MNSNDWIQQFASIFIIIVIAVVGAWPVIIWVLRGVSCDGVCACVCWGVACGDGC